MGHPKKEPTLEDRKIAYSDNTDCIEVERDFSLAKKCCVLELIKTKLDTTIHYSIALYIGFEPLKTDKEFFAPIISYIDSAISMQLTPTNNLNADLYG